MKRSLRKQSYDPACSHTPQQIVTCNRNTISTSPKNDFGKGPVVTPTSTKTPKKNLVSVPNSPFSSSCQKTVKSKTNSISFPINTMQCNKVVDFTSSENSVSNTSKLQSFPISLYNVDNRDKSLPLPLSTTSKAFQCKETGVQESTDNGRKSKSNSSEKRDLLFLPDLHQICLQTFSLNPILNGKTDVSANKKIYFSKYY